jgi:hypothetical protein
MRNDKKILYYAATFDGGVYYSGSNARFVMNMREENRDYIEFIQGVLPTESKIHSVIQRGNREPLLCLTSKTHPVLTKIRERIYIGNHKVLDPMMLKAMDAEALAIIFMADGGSSLDTRFKKPHSEIALHTKGFSYAENMALSKVIYEKLGIETRVCRHGKYWFLRVRTKCHIKFCAAVAPFMKPSFFYKLERVAPAFISGDDIV